MNRTLIIFVLLCALLLSACGTQPVVPTATPVPSSTPTPTPTDTPTPSATPTPTATSTPTASPTPSATPTPTPKSMATPFPTSVLGRTFAPSNTPGALESLSAVFGSPKPVPVSVPRGGFTFMSPGDLRADVQLSTVELNSASLVEGPQIAVFFIGMDKVPAGTSSNQALTSLLDDVFSKTGSSYTTANPRPVTLAGAAGQWVEVTGKLDGKAVRGEAAAVVAANGQSIMGIGIALDDLDGSVWAKTGVYAFDMILSTLCFTPVGPGTCAISTDKTYGYTVENPVKVGGGPARERAFFDNLRGPNGEKVTYTRSGSQNVGTSDFLILDIYSVSYAGLAAPAKIYVDMYNYAPLYAPLGFTCAGAFTIAAP